MAGNTICRPDSLVVEISWRPGICVVAGGTLDAIVVGGLVTRMADQAVRRGRQGVVEICILPATRCVAGRTIAWVVFGGFIIYVTGFTPGRSPIVNTLAVTICTFEKGVFSYQRVKFMLTRRAVQRKRDTQWVTLNRFVPKHVILGVGQIDRG